MAINSPIQIETRGRKYPTFVPPTPQQLCDMLKNIPFNGNTVAPGSTLVVGYNDPDCPEFMNVEKDIYVTDMIGTKWDDATNTITWTLNLSNGNQVSIPITIEDLMGIWFVNQSRVGDFGDTIVINNITAEKFTSPNGTVAITTDNISKETRFEVDMCKVGESLPLGDYDVTAKMIQFKVGGPVGFTGFEFDYSNDFGTTNASDTYMHIVEDIVAGQVYYMPPAITNPTTPVVFTDAAPIQNAIDQALTANGYNAGDIVWQVVSPTQVVVWYNLSAGALNTIFANMFWAGLNVPDQYTNKTIPTIPTSVVAGVGCPELVEIPKNRFRTYQPLVVGSNLIVHNLGYSEVMVEVRNDATGELVSCRVVNETTTSCELELSMTVATARITVR